MRRCTRARSQQSLEAARFDDPLADRLGQGSDGALAGALSLAARALPGTPCADGGTGHWSGDRTQTTLWSDREPRPGRGRPIHGTQKPVECMRRPMLNNTSPGQAIYDPFLGSGTSLIAAETSGGVCCGLELDPAYVDVIVTRWAAFTGDGPTLAATGETFAAVQAARLGTAGVEAEVPSDQAEG